MKQKLEDLLEATIWNSRFFLIIASLCSVAAAIAYVGLGAYEIIHMIGKIISVALDGATEKAIADGKMTLGFIMAIDHFLIATVMLIFGIGIYEIFISNIDAYDKAHPAAKILDIRSLEELKSKIAGGVVMILVVTLFKHTLSIQFNEAIDLLILAGTILLISLSVFLLSKSKAPAPSKQ